MLEEKYLNLEIKQLDSKQQMIDEFVRFIENVPNESDIHLPHEQSTDLLTLCKEFIALKTEVKQESRHFKNALDSFKEVFHTLQQSHDVLAQELASRREQQSIEIDKQKHALLKPLFLDLIELRDRIEIGLKYSKNFNLSFFARLINRFIKSISIFITDINEGQTMTLRRLDQILIDYDIRTVNTLHQPFDPKYMRAVAVDECLHLPDGVVTADITKGYLWKDAVLRLAEVKVNQFSEVKEVE